MLPLFKSKVTYSTVEDGDYEEELKLGGASQSKSRPWSLLLITTLFLLSLIPTLILILDRRLSSQHDTVILASNGPSWVCQQPTTRREWRTLSEPEKLDYVTAVKCLATKPSKLRNNGTLYDDFPWVHKHLSSKSGFSFIFLSPHLEEPRRLNNRHLLSSAHVSAAFLPWHRQYIHLYEKALREECAFDSDLP